MTDRYSIHRQQTYLEDIAAEGISGNWLLPSNRVRAAPMAATVVRHRFFDERIKEHLCEFTHTASRGERMLVYGLHKY